MRCMWRLDACDAWDAWDTWDACRDVSTCCLRVCHLLCGVMRLWENMNVTPILLRTLGRSLAQDYYYLSPADLEMLRHKKLIWSCRYSDSSWMRPLSCWSSKVYWYNHTLSLADLNVTLHIKRQKMTLLIGGVSRSLVWVRHPIAETLG